MKKKEKEVRGFVFNKFEEPEKSVFDRLFDIFKEIITHTSGDLDEALDWLRQLDDEYQLTTDDYSIDDFVEELKQKGYIKEEIEPDGTGGMSITAKTERAIRQQALEQIFGRLKKGGAGNHRTNKTGRGDEHTGDFRQYQYGDSLSRISMTESLRNAQINNGIGRV